MPNWNDVLKEISAGEAPLDSVRRKYLKRLHKQTGRNIIAYYSGWLQCPGVRGTDISDVDKNGFMAAIHRLDRTKGLDLILHTPGGEVAATESIVYYLRQMFGTDIRAIIPQISMSSGTLIACSCKSIIMGKHSSLGPIDPQFSGIPAQGVIEEFKHAISEVKRDPQSLPIWQTIISKYHPTFIGQCKKAVSWAHEIATEWMKTGMFEGDTDADTKAKTIADWLIDHKKSKNHSRHIHLNDCVDKGLKIDKLEDMGDNLQDTILTVHHTFMHTFSNSAAIKIIENHMGKATVLAQSNPV